MPPTLPPEQMQEKMSRSGRSGMSAEERRRLLCAIKPALSKRRADAIDSILPLIDIIDLFSGR